LSTTTFLLCQLGAFVAYFIYGSYFEWFLHRYIFHAPQPILKFMFDRHTLVHHQIYKGDHTYYVQEGHAPEKVTMSWWALFAVIGGHLPLFFLVQWITHIPSVWGGVAAITAYYGLYESLHYVMHVPKSAEALSRFRVFRFLEGHHKVHHRHMLSNLNVIFPLADVTLGTLRDATGKRTNFFRKKSARMRRTEAA
jgi:hypothetical protein